MDRPRSAPLDIAALERAAAAGDPAAAHALFHIFARGKRADRDVDRAMAFLRQAAAAGHPPAQVSLGEEIYRNDKEGALACFLAAAAAGHGPGQLAAGRMLLVDRFVARDEVRALTLLAAAARHGDPEAVAMHERATRMIAAAGRTDAENLALAIAEFGLERSTDAIFAVTRPSVRLVARAVADEGDGASGSPALGLGASKLGGRADLAPGTPWPAHDGRPLDFIAQVDLAILAPLHADPALPRDGLLSFFYDADQQPWGNRDEDGRWAVLHQAPGPLVRTGDATFTACALDAFAELTLPPARSALARSLHLDRYGQIADRFCGDARRAPRQDGQVHRLLGHPDAIQGDMTRCIEYDLHDADLDQPTPELEAAAATWRLLLQIDSEPLAGMMWGDLGRLYVWLRDADLAARRWGAARLQLQCS